MLLALDIGNTNITAAFFENSLIVSQFRLNSDINQSSGYFASQLASNTSENCSKKLEKVIISSVVPELTEKLSSAVFTAFGLKSFIMTADLTHSPLLPVHLPENSTRKMGTDLLCNALYGYKESEGKASIVVDFGTALTITATDNKGLIQGGSISPGLGTAMKSLFSNTAQLPQVPLECPESYLGNTTVEAIQSGVILGYKGLVEQLVSGMKKEMAQKCGLKESEIIVFVTGGLHRVIKPLTSVFDRIDEDLTVKGLKYAADFLL